MDGLLERITKMRLSPHGGVAGRLKMLTYYVYAPLFRLSRHSFPSDGGPFRVC